MLGANEDDDDDDDDDDDETVRLAQVVKEVRATRLRKTEVQVCGWKEELTMRQ